MTTVWLRARRASLTLLALVPLASPAVVLGLECPAGNLLAERLPVAVHQVAGDLGRATDGRAAPEGAIWDSAPAVVLDGAEASLTWDLGAVRELRALLVQGDANDRLPLSGSLDGRTFTPLGEAAALADVAGLRTRTVVLLAPVAVRFLRLDPPDGDGFASVAEVQAFCALPRPWPPVLTVEAAPLPAPTLFTYWNDLSSRWWELLLALLGVALLVWDARRERREGPPEPRSRRRWLFLAGTVVAALTYFNFGAFHFGAYVHSWDTLHYYLGAKYFDELSYDRLYECIAVADAAEPRLARRVERREITNLRTNVLEPAAEVLAHPERCTAHFSAARWRAFTADVAYFRAREGAQRWEEISTDHGFNGTPVWLLAGSWLANRAPASDRQILALTLLDPLYLAAMAAVVGWAFGARPLAVALLVFATFFPCRFFWTGGAFLRWDWLFYTVAAVACLKKGRPWLGGLALGYAAMLRVFPGLLAAGPIAAVVALIGREVGRAHAEKRTRGPAAGGALAPLLAGLRTGLRRPEVRTHLRFLAGAALATALLVPMSLAASGGTDSYRAFVANTRKHQATPLTNHMGLRTVLAYRPSEVGRHMVKDGSTDPWLAWKEARLAAWRQARPFAALLGAAALLLLGRAALRRPEPWIAAALGALWIAFAVELTSYYYAFVFVPALLWIEKRSAGIALLALAAFTQLVSLGPLLGMPTWRDEQYTLISAASLAVFAGLLLAFGRAPLAAELPPARIVEEPPATKPRGARSRQGKRP